MQKKEIFTFRGMQQDVTRSKHPKEFYYEGRNIRVSTTDSQSTGSVINEKGNKLVLSIPSPIVDVTGSKITYDNKTLKFSGIANEITDTYTGKTSGTQNIIGHAEAREDVILFSTDDNGFDCIWRLTEDLDLTLLYIRDLGFKIENPLQCLFNFENKKLQKVYWVDGEHQLRFINLSLSKANGDRENLIDLDSNAINIVGDFTLSQPIITSIGQAGTHTSGMIQYTYNLYKVNGSQTKLAPLSELVALAKPNRGGDVNEVVGASPNLSFNGLDNSYTNIKVYAIKYTSYNQIPQVSLIKDEEINGQSFSFVDSGNTIQDLSLEEFLFLGSNPISPKHIETKDSSLFMANVKENNFDVNIDTRAYGHNNSGISVIEEKNSEGFFPKRNVPADYLLSLKHDSINAYPDTQIYQKDGVTKGGEGKYIKYELVPITYDSVDDLKDIRLFKSNEYYRLGLQFYNKLGQTSFPKWMGDFIAPDTLGGTYHKLKVTLKSDFYVWLNDSNNFETEDDKPVGYKVLRADRTAGDKSIICQGIINGMVSSVTHTENNFAQTTTEGWEQGLKLPSLLRTFGDVYPRLKGVKEFRTLTNGSDKPNNNEFWNDEGHKLARTYQFNKLMQMYSPDVMFGNVSLRGGLNIRVLGVLKKDVTRHWNQIRSPETKEILRAEEGDGLTGNKVGDYGIFGPTTVGRGSTEMDFYQFYRAFKEFVPSPTNKYYQLAAAPEITERGQGATYYNGNAKLNYYNSLEPLITDSSKDGDPVTTVNSFGAKCLTFAVGPDLMSNQIEVGTGFGAGSLVTSLNLRSLDVLYNDMGINEPDSVILAELYSSDYDSLYGGRTYEEKKRTNYIEIGTYKSISIDNVTIDSPGDTFIGNFQFTKLAKTDTEVYSNTALQVTEIVKFPVETSIDLKNRNDISKEDWTSRFQPRYDEYHKYNRVYSQSPTLINRRDAEYTFKKVDHFDTKIIATKSKIPGEVIDSWTDILVNEDMFVDGKYGPINSLVNFKDELYSFQDKAFSHIAINPRVQVQGSDGIGVELGTGRLLHDYKYISTDSGSINKWGVLASEYGIYYVDLLNKTLNRFSGQLDKLSIGKGMHSWTVNTLDIDILSKDNPLIKQGVIVGNDPINNNIFFTFLQPNEDTLMFDEKVNGFVSFMDYVPTRYFKNRKGIFVTKDNEKIYEQYKGDYNNFFDQNPSSTSSYITLMINPNVNMECVFDNIEYNSELYLNDIDQPDKTLTHIHAWNEYQDSGKIPLTLGRNSNLRRKFRTWRANIPRDGRNRMRNPWIYLKLELDNTNNYKFILHDIIVNYTFN